jgi:glycosyltransferase involved in cell wall biosynthesis
MSKLQNDYKVCFIYYMRFSAIIYREAKSLKDRGFGVDVICLRDSCKENIFQTYQGINLYCIQAREEREKKTFSYFMKLFAFCIKATVLMCWLGIKKRYDIVHVTSPPDILVFAAIVPKLLGTKLILDIHDIGPELYMRKLHKHENGFIIRMLRYCEKISTRFADHVITVTDLWKNRLERSVPVSKCTTILNVPDDRLFKPYDLMERIRSNRLRLSYHGSLEEHFGVDLLLEALPEVKSQVPHIELVIYGTGRLRGKLEEEIKKNNMGDYVRINDFVPFHALPTVLQEAAIGIVPTKSDVFSGEALSMKTLEYMSLGIPVLVSRTPVHNYYYDDSIVKFFTPCDKTDFTKALVELCMDKTARQRLAENGKIFIKEHGWQAERKKYYDIIDRLIQLRCGKS